MCKCASIGVLVMMVRKVGGCEGDSAGAAAYDSTHVPRRNVDDE
jgi:hypothetical protein